MESSSNTESCDVSETTCNGKVDLEEAHPPTCKGTVSILPRGNGLICPEDFGLFQYEGFWHHSFYLKGVKLTQEQFEPQSTDIILYSAPKSSTTWLKALAFSIVTRTKFDFSANPLIVKVPHDCVPMLEGPKGCICLLLAFHMQGYWKASLEQPEKVLFLKYEDMKRETSVYVK
ncbi:hypothetical protein RHGRI_035332 [Rhododendron griersonianum]|uniref:Sulfotransferase n=1 Tax=Rhododendron griersonianum TaxID=479676 RepID=A0AAV6I6V1_9ERIC|nr:hypothetical protein RHGRI_035332 [Rhododendron griersonianum]